MTAAPIRTAEVDANYLSLNSDSVVWFAGTNQEHAGNIPYPLDLIPANPKAWDSILKCSGRRNTHLTSIRAAQGKENVWDCNNETAYCSFFGDWGVVGTEGQQIGTVKGGSHDLVFGGKVRSRGTDCDFEIGAWSDQSMAPSHTLDYSSLEHITGRPLTFVFGRVHQPWKALLGKAPDDILLPPNAQVDIWGSITEIVGWWAKRLYVKVRYKR